MTKLRFYMKKIEIFLFKTTSMERHISSRCNESFTAQLYLTIEKMYLRN